MNRVLSLRAYEFRLNAIELDTDVRAGPAAGARRRRTAPAGAAQPAAQRRAGDARARRCAACASARATCREATASSCRSPTPATAFPARTCAASSIPSSRRATSARGPASASASATASSAITAARSRCESRVGLGTTFTLLLPAAPGKPSESLRALVAHRDPTERDYVAAALTGWGHSVIAAESAADAMRSRLRGGGLDVALIEKPLMGDAPAWRGVLDAGEHTRTRDLVDGSGGRRRGRPSIRTDGTACAPCAGRPRSAYERAEAAARRRRRRAGHPRRGQSVGARAPATTR